MKLWGSIFITTIFLNIVSGVAQSNATSNSTSSRSLATKDNVAIYWGQNSIGYLSNFKNNEKELWWYCNWDQVDVILLAFMHDFPGTYSSKYGMKIPTIKFPHHTNAEFSVNNTNTMKRVASDIKYCQKKNKKILLSLGGEGGTYGFTSTSQAKEFGYTLWNMFGEITDNTNKSIPRPFGDAVIDGFDFDIEDNNQVGYVDLIETLRNYSSNSTSGDDKTSKKFYLSAAPQCPYPDQNMNSILTSAHLDMVFVQFYNNKCNANNLSSSSSSSTASSATSSATSSSSSNSFVSASTASTATSANSWSSSSTSASSGQWEGSVAKRDATAWDDGSWSASQGSTSSKSSSWSSAEDTSSSASSSIVSSNENSFNWDTWSQYAKKVSVNSNVQLYLGLPGSVNSSSSGYIDNSTYLAKVIDQVKDDEHFAGVMLWEASLSFQNKLKDSKKTYPLTVKSLLKKLLDSSTSSTNEKSVKNSSSSSSSSSDKSMATRSVKISVSLWVVFACYIFFMT